MATRNVIVSDLSGKDIPEDQHARIIITDHPALRGSAVELDVTAEEAAKLQSGQISLVTADVYEPGKPRRSIAIEASAFNALYKGVEMEAVISKARKVATGTTARKPRGTASTGTKLDYTEPENIGLIHRGRVTDEEARLVRENMEQANKNRARVGQPAIGQDAKDAARYGL